jgi:hypothetical protein
MRKDPSPPISDISSGPPTTFSLKRSGASKLVLLLFLGCGFGSFIKAQPVYEHVSNTGIYQFLDEMANLGYFELNSAIKPYTRTFICEKLEELKGASVSLTSRQRRELELHTGFFLDNPPEGKPVLRLQQLDFAFNDSVFSLRMQPILGGSFLFNPAEDVTSPVQFNRFSGASIVASYRNSWGIYGSLRDHYTSSLMVTPGILLNQPGGQYKPGDDLSAEFSEMRGGMVWQNRLLTFALVKDHFEWGTNYQGASIFSAREPSTTQFRFSLKPLKWFEFNYLHAWLNSAVIDSIRSFSYISAYGNGTRLVYRQKYLAANMFTIKPWKHTFISFGNSIIYADMGVHPAYLTPFSFFKSIDHTLNSTTNDAGQNSQMFIDISTRIIPHTHFYTVLFIDELATTVMFNPDKHSNCISFKGGFSLTDLPLPNVTIIGEYTRSNPLAYKHFVPTTTFESNRYNLGYYLMDNAEESCVEIIWKPWRGLSFETACRYARKGPDYNALGGKRRGLPFMSEERWHRAEITAELSYQLTYNTFARLGYQFLRSGGPDAAMYLPEALQGQQHLISCGLNIAF